MNVGIEKQFANYYIPMHPCFQDVIWNDNIKLDEMFKFSLATDIFKVSEIPNVCGMRTVLSWWRWDLLKLCVSYSREGNSWLNMI